MTEKTFTDSAGKTRVVWVQEQMSSCAAAAAYMAASMNGHRSLVGGEAKVRSAFFKHGLKPTDLLLGQGNRSMDQIAEVLLDQGIKISSNWANQELLKKILLQADESRPVIANIQWVKGQGGHQIVCVGKPDSLLVFLDPFYGLVEEDPAMLPNYNPAFSGSTNIATGRFSGWYAALI